MFDSMDEILPIAPGEGFGSYGGQFVAETLMQPLQELEKAFADVSESSQLEDELAHYVGRPTAVTFAGNLSRSLGGAKIYLKREDLNHTGAHKINNVVGQVLLAKSMGKTRVIAETGAGQHGVATATVAARFQMKCRIYMGKRDGERQIMNVHRMKVLGAEVVLVEAGEQTLKEAINEALRDWVSDPVRTYYLMGSALGPHPYPSIVRSFQSVIGREARTQILAREGRLPDEAVACVGGGSNAIGLFSAFLKDDVRLTGVEAGGKSLKPGQHAARFSGGRVGVFQGTKTIVLQDCDGQITSTKSVAPGLDYAAVGPEHAHLHATGRAQYTSVPDKEAIEAFHVLAKSEGIIPALESAHALAYAIQRAPCLGKDKILLVNLSGRGDKDLDQLLAAGGL